MSVAETNAGLIRKGYAAFNAGDMKTLDQIFQDNATWHTPGRSSLGGDHKGKEAVFAQFGRYGSGTNGTFKANMMHVFTDEAGNAVSVHRNTGERNGKHLDVLCCIVFSIKDGKVQEGREVFYDLHAWDGFWA